MIVHGNLQIIGDCIHTEEKPWLTMRVHNKITCTWWFNYPGPLLEVELESACLSGLGCGLCIALIRPNHWAASVAQWLEHLSSKQCVVGSNPTRAALFSFRRKKSCLG